MDKDYALAMVSIISVVCFWWSENELLLQCLFQEKGTSIFQNPLRNLPPKFSCNVLKKNSEQEKKKLLLICMYNFGQNKIYENAAWQYM